MQNLIFTPPAPRPLPRPDLAPGVAVAALVVLTLAALAGEGAPTVAERAEPEAQRVLEDWRGNSANLPAPGQ